MNDIDRDCPICGDPQQEHTVLCEGCDEYRQEEGPCEHRDVERRDACDS